MNGNGQETPMEERRVAMVYMAGYLPGATPEKSPIVSPVPAPLPETACDSWKEVCGGGCGFAVAISGCGKLITWGSADDLGQSHITSGKHGETPEPFPLPTDALVVNAAAGWAHCAAVTDTGEVYAWGWKECVPSGKLSRDALSGGDIPKEPGGKQAEPVSPSSKSTNATSTLHSEIRKAGNEVVKRRKVSSLREESEGLTSGEDFFAQTPSLVTLSPGVRITSVAAGGRHSLALSDVGQVWGWGYGGEGQLGLGSRIKMVSTPHLIPCIEQHSPAKERPFLTHQASSNLPKSAAKFTGNYVKAIACGGRHSAVVTDTGALLTFGWSLYGQCGHGNTSDQLRPSYVSSLSGRNIEKVAAGLWHTICNSAEGDIYAFGGNQFGQLGTGSDQNETVPKLLDAPSLENKRAKVVSCGARHSSILTGEGELLSWGWNKYGQLGVGDTIDRNIPTVVDMGRCVIKNVACGWWHTLLVTDTRAETGG